MSMLERWKSTGSHFPVEQNNCQKMHILEVKYRNNLYKWIMKLLYCCYSRYFTGPEVIVRSLVNSFECVPTTVTRAKKWQLPILTVTCSTCCWDKLAKAFEGNWEYIGEEEEPGSLVSLVSSLHIVECLGLQKNNVNSFGPQCKRPFYIPEVANSVEFVLLRYCKQKPLLWIDSCALSNFFSTVV